MNIATELKDILGLRSCAVSDCVREVVLSRLGQFPGRAMTAGQLKSELLAWLQAIPVKPKPVLCYH